MSLHFVEAASFDSKHILHIIAASRAVLSIAHTWPFSVPAASHCPSGLNASAVTVAPVSSSLLHSGSLSGSTSRGEPWLLLASETATMSAPRSVLTPSTSPEAGDQARWVAVSAAAYRM